MVEDEEVVSVVEEVSSVWAGCSLCWTPTVTPNEPHWGKGEDIGWASTNTVLTGS